MWRGFWMHDTDFRWSYHRWKRQRRVHTLACGGALHKGECVSRFLPLYHYYSHGCPTKSLKRSIGYRKPCSQIYAPSEATHRPRQVLQIIQNPQFFSRNKRVWSQWQQQRGDVSTSNGGCGWTSFSVCGCIGRSSGSFNTNASEFSLCCPNMSQTNHILPPSGSCFCFPAKCFTHVSSYSSLLCAPICYSFICYANHLRIVSNRPDAWQWNLCHCQGGYPHWDG